VADLAVASHDGPPAGGPFSLPHDTRRQHLPLPHDDDFAFVQGTPHVRAGQRHAGDERLRNIVARPARSTVSLCSACDWMKRIAGAVVTFSL